MFHTTILFITNHNAPDKERILIAIMFFSSAKPMFDHLLESSHEKKYSNKWSNIGFGKEITRVGSIKGRFTKLIWEFAPYYKSFFQHPLLSQFWKAVVNVCKLLIRILKSTCLATACWFYSSCPHSKVTSTMTVVIFTII